MRRLAATLALTLALLGAAHAQQLGEPGGGELPTGVAEDQITVSSDYRGASLTVFGVNPDRRGRGDIVVVVRGPSESATVMRKRRALGFIWVNSDPVQFRETPTFFAVLSNRPLRQILSPDLIWRYGLDPAAAARLDSAVPAGADPSAYRAALVRLRRAQGLYQEYVGQAPQRRGGLTAYQGGLFRAVVPLPANAPIAEYYADTYLFREGRLISSQRVPITIERVGIERRIHDLATGGSFLYGLITVMIALGAGWGAALLFRRT